MNYSFRQTVAKKRRSSMCYVTLSSEGQLLLMVMRLQIYTLVNLQVTVGTNTAEEKCYCKFLHIE